MDKYIEFETVEDIPLSSCRYYITGYDGLSKYKLGEFTNEDKAKMYLNTLLFIGNYKVVYKKNILRD